MALPERAAIHSYVSPEAKEAWEHFSEENGVSVTSLIEALGLELAEELKHADADDIRGAWVKSARRIDAQRRRRG